MFNNYVTYRRAAEKHSFAIYNNSGMFCLEIQYVGKKEHSISTLGMDCQKTIDIINEKRNELLAKGYKEVVVKDFSNCSKDTWSYGK